MGIILDNLVPIIASSIAMSIPLILASVGGLMVDGSCRVLDTGDQVIEGLYAVGNASGGFFAGNYPRHIPGTSIGRAITFGYVAAEHAVKGA